MPELSSEDSVKVRATQKVESATDRWLTIAQAATYLQVCQTKLRAVLHEGHIKAVKIGRHYRIDRNDLDNYMVRRKQIVPPYRKGTHPWVADRHATEREAAR